MKNAVIALLLAFCPVLATCQSAKSLDVRIASINGPCFKIVGNKCYNAYETDTWNRSKGEFGWYSFSDPSQKVTFVEKFDCSHPNKRVKWGSANPSNPNEKMSIYRSKKVKGLYESCYGDVLADANGQCRHGLKPFSCDRGTCCP